jgi:hypothetical protein
MLKLIENSSQRKELSTNIKQLGIPDASERIAAEVKKILDQL